MDKIFLARINGTIPNGAVEELAWDYIDAPEDADFAGEQLPLRNIRDTATLEMISPKGLFVISGIRKAVTNTFAGAGTIGIARVSFDLDGKVEIEEPRMTARDTLIQIRTEGGRQDHYFHFMGVASFNIGRKLIE